MLSDSVTDHKQSVLVDPCPYRQVVHLYPDGEIRYKVALSRKERDSSKCATSSKERLISKNDIVIKESKDFNVQSDRIAQTRPGWGKLSKPKKFTIYAKNTIRRIGGAMQLEFGKERLAIMTLTVPGGANKVIETIAKYSGYIMNRIQTYLTDNYKFDDGKKYVVGVTELQKRGMLHWHFLVALKDKLAIEAFREKIEAFWFRVLKQLSEISGVDLFKRKEGDSWKVRYEHIKHRAVDIQSVKKNVAGYLAKYMSKGYTKVKSRGKVICYSPSRWWSKSDDAMALMHNWTVSWDLPSVSEQFLKDVMIPGVKEFLVNGEMWCVESFNRYTKQISAIIGRNDYQVCKEWCDDLIPVLLDMCKECQLESAKYQKAYHQNIFEMCKKKQEMIVERVEVNRNEFKRRKQYFRFIDEFGMTPDDAYNAVFGNRIDNRLDVLINGVSGVETKFVYDHKIGGLIEVSIQEYERLRFNSE